MSENSSIEWTDHTWSPVWGCTEVSTAATGGGGCDNCYARVLANRFGTGWGHDAPRRQFGDDHWRKPLLWNERARKTGAQTKVFPSMCDPFDKDWPEGVRERFWDLIEATPNLTWLILTKRIGNTKRMLPEAWLREPRENVWLGATVVNQAEANRDIPKLLATPARIVFLSCEPLLGPIDLRECGEDLDGYGFGVNALTGVWDAPGVIKDRSTTSRVGWLIAGGESGPKARPAHPNWFRSLRDQCSAAGVPFLFKQWGEWAPWNIAGEMPLTNTKHVHLDDTETMTWIGKKAAGRLLDGAQHDGFPE